MSINLRPSEQKALLALAFRERRDPREQAAVIIRAELERRGLLPADPGAPDAVARPAEAEAEHAA